MLICAVGDTHGELAAMYERVASLEAEVGRRVDLVLQVGDFGVWPDPARLDAATRKHGDNGEFRRLLATGAVPRPTVFIAGNHEDFVYLGELGGGRVVEDLTFLPWGRTITFEAGGERLRIGGVGGCYGARDYHRHVSSSAARRHYTAHDLRRLREEAAGGLDVLLLHEPPAGRVTELHAPPHFSPRTWTLVGQGQAELIAALQPRICFTGHIHARTERRIQGVRTVGLNKVPYRGSVVLFELLPGEAPRDLAEWGGAPDDDRPITPETVDIDDSAAQALMDALVKRLEAWAVEVRGEQAPPRDERKRLHARLADEPLRPVLMGALLGADVRALIEMHVPPERREGVLLGWSVGALPAVGRLG